MIREQGHEGNVTFTAVTAVGLEAGLAGAEGVGAVHHTMSFISISTHCPVTAAVIQHRVCKKSNGSRKLP